MKEGVPGILLAIALLMIPAAMVPPDLVNNFINLSKIAPVSGAPIGNVTQEMSHYNSWLSNTATSMMSFFDQIMSAFGIGQANLGNTSGDIQQTLQQVINPVNGSLASP